VNWENHHGGDLGKCRCCLVVGRSCSSCNNYNHMGMYGLGKGDGGVDEE
jgi:hypothetical protein